MKLKKSVPVTQVDPKEDMYHCCRWCHHYQNGKCYNNNIQIIDDSAVFEVAESGRLDEVLEETLKSEKLTPFKELEYKLLEWNVSQKRIKEFNELFSSCYEEFALHLKESLDESVSRLYQTDLDDITFDGLEISNPEEYYCKDWC